MRSWYSAPECRVGEQVANQKQRDQDEQEGRIPVDGLVPDALQSHLTESVYKVVWQKSIPARNHQLYVYYH